MGNFSCAVKKMIVKDSGRVFAISMVSQIIVFFAVLIFLYVLFPAFRQMEHIEKAVVMSGVGFAAGIEIVILSYVIYYWCKK